MRWTNLFLELGRRRIEIRTDVAPAVAREANVKGVFPVVYAPGRPVSDRARSLVSPTPSDHRRYLDKFVSTPLLQRRSDFIL
jgi:hypothetical protein